MQVLLGHLGLEERALFGVDPSATEHVSGLECLLVRAELCESNLESGHGDEEKEAWEKAKVDVSHKLEKRSFFGCILASVMHDKVAVFSGKQVVCIDMAMEMER